MLAGALCALQREDSDDKTAMGSCREMDQYHPVPYWLLQHYGAYRRDDRDHDGQVPDSNCFLKARHFRRLGLLDFGLASPLARPLLLTLIADVRLMHLMHPRLALLSKKQIAARLVVRTMQLYDRFLVGCPVRSWLH